MNIPSVKIGPFRYPVSFVDDLHSFDGSMKIELWGHIKANEIKIELLPSLDAQRQLQVLWHEILHGILANAGYDVHDEKQIDAISTGIIQVLRDNPLLADETLYGSEGRAGQYEAAREQLRGQLNQVNGNNN